MPTQNPIVNPKNTRELSHFSRTSAMFWFLTVFHFVEAGGLRAVLLVHVAWHGHVDLLR